MLEETARSGWQTARLGTGTVRQWLCWSKVPLCQSGLPFPVLECCILYWASQKRASRTGRTGEAERAEGKHCPHCSKAAGDARCAQSVPHSYQQQQIPGNAESKHRSWAMHSAALRLCCAVQRWSAGFLGWLLVLLQEGKWGSPVQGKVSRGWERCRQPGSASGTGTQLGTSRGSHEKETLQQNWPSFPICPNFLATEPTWRSHRARFYHAQHPHTACPPNPSQASYQGAPQRYVSPGNTGSMWQMDCSALISHPFFFYSSVKGRN